jgi:hypothetical protein
LEDATTIGAVPMATVEVMAPLVVSEAMLDRFPALSRRTAPPVRTLEAVFTSPATSRVHAGLLFPRPRFDPSRNTSPALLLNRLPPPPPPLPPPTNATPFWRSWPVKLISPTTSNWLDGLDFPMPTLVENAVAFDVILTAATSDCTQPSRMF